MPTIYKYAVARRDLIEHYVYLAENASLGVADRFLVNAEESFTELSRQPMIGTPLRLSNPRLDGVRKWAVKNFDNYLIFYMPRGDGVAIVRVLHAAQGWWSVLGILG